ncbi:MAG: ferrous iron transport protein A [Candidatus Improbicoccus devescovinae]|nr:MAG: ferrous iron transport protein A [Candidatus Improbicoccus devescovinae]
MNLSELKIGQRAKVTDIIGESAIKRRLMDMGFVPDSIVEIIRYAPMGDPVQVEIENIDIVIRKDDAKNIIINKL